MKPFVADITIAPVFVVAVMMLFPPVPIAVWFVIRVVITVTLMIIELAEFRRIRRPARRNKNKAEQGY